VRDRRLMSTQSAFAALRSAASNLHVPDRPPAGKPNLNATRSPSPTGSRDASRILADRSNLPDLQGTAPVSATRHPLSSTA
jgi:hypothetical protein